LSRTETNARYCQVGYLLPAGRGMLRPHKSKMWCDLAIAEIFGVGVGIAEIVVDKYCGLAG